jgi:RHS repeat-associated protein
MLLVPAASRIRTVMLVLMIMLVQFVSAGVPGNDNKNPRVYKFITDCNNAYIAVWPAWLQGCDSLNHILLGPLTAGNVSCRWQPAYAEWLQQAGNGSVADFMRGYFFIDANPVYNSYVPGTTLYQAYESITFDVGFQTAVGDEFIAEIVGVTPPTSGGSANTNMNWVLAKTFDENGNVTNENKQFFDNSGRSMQTQSRVNYRQNYNNTTVTNVFASQPLRDALGREVVNTMSAPINNSEFGYKPDFVLNKSGDPYTYKDFDRFNPAGTQNDLTDKTNSPDPVGGQAIPGTLGWYYGSNNTLEPYTATSEFPYSRKSIYRDGTGSAKKIAAAGEVFIMGSNRESSTYTTPVSNELTNYLQVRNRFFPSSKIGELPANLANNALQLVAKDANGKETVVINDNDGNTLMTARPGSDLQVANSVILTAADAYPYKLFASHLPGVGVTINSISGANDINVYNTYNGPATLVYSGPATSWPMPAGYGGDISVESTGPFSIIYQVGDREGNLGDAINLSSQYNPSNAILYFRIFNDNSAVSISGDYTLYDMNMNTEAATNLVNGNQLNKGYYKVKANSGAVTVNYANGYTDITYNFYNQLGKNVASIAPEGVKKLLGTGYANYTTLDEVPFVSTSEYDTQGRLVKSTTTDGGTNEIVYRADGHIRFAQNADQKTNGRYSYTNYDKFGRAIESGEYKPETGGISFNNDLTAASNPMRDILEDISATGGLTNGTKKDVIMTLYDVTDNTHGQGTNYEQAPQYLGGKVSMIRKYSSIVNNTPNSANLISCTWFNYDENESILWKVFYIQGLGYKTLNFTYDINGRIVKKDFQKGDPTGTERFIHYYEYDPVTQNLWKIRTSVDDVTKILQATYIYYLHGPLKRIELATNLQGIDYTYTLQGALKAINNSDKTKDPGGDGSTFSADAFGMVLDYYQGDYQNSRTHGIQPIKGVNTAGLGADSYTGDIKAMTWFSKKPAAIVGSTPGIEDPTTYVYQYDDKSQFTESTWGTGIDFNSTPAGFTATGLNKEVVKNASGGTAYDANGNILYLQRTGRFTDNFTYNYLNSTTNTGSVSNYNTNRLQSVVNNASGTPQTYASYIYNNAGQLITELNTFGGTDKSKYIEYDAAGKVAVVYRDALKTQKVVEYVYDEMGDQVIKKSYNAGQLSQITYYMGSVIYTQPVTNGTLGAITVQEYEIQGVEGRLGTFYRQIPVYAYELNDHLGNVRAVVAKSANALEVRVYTDYYPFGTEIRSDGDYRHGYQGQYAKKETETDWNAFELRMYDSRIARWLSVDPAGQFTSPYVAMGNNPVTGTDPDGGFSTWLGALLNQGITGNRGHIYKSDGGVWGYNCENCGVTDGSGVSYIYRNGQYNRARHEENERRMDAVNLEYVRQHDRLAASNNQPTIIPGYKNDGRIIVSDGHGNVRASWNEAIEYPAIDPVDGAAGLVGMLGKALAKKAATQGTLYLLGEWGGDEAVAYCSKNVIPKRGWYDWVSHGTTDGLGSVFKNEAGETLSRVDAEGLYKLMLADGYKPGTPIRLLVCNSGKYPEGLAQQISKLANAMVAAPTRTMTVSGGENIFPKGMLVVLEGGKMTLFKP